MDIQVSSSSSSLLPLSLPLYPSLLLHLLLSLQEFKGMLHFLLLLLFSSPSLSFSLLSSFSTTPAGPTYSSTSADVGSNSPVKEHDRWSMELNLTSTNPDQRTIRWFVNGVQQPIFFNRIPAQVQFGVCVTSFSSFILFSFLLFSSLLFSPLLDRYTLPERHLRIRLVGASSDTEGETSSERKDVPMG